MTLTGSGSSPGSAKPAARPSVHAAATEPASPSPQPSPSPSTSPTPAPPPAPTFQLAASLSIFGRGGFTSLVFQVSDTGSATTGPVTAFISLPAGTSLFSGDNQQHQGGRGNGSADGTAQPFSDWNCQPASGGAVCTHGAMSGGQQTEGMLFVAVTGSGACGQPVSLSVTSGGETVWASQAIAC
jgi:hypothetical protein